MVGRIIVGSLVAWALWLIYDQCWHLMPTTPAEQNVKKDAEQAVKEHLIQAVQSVPDRIKNGDSRRAIIDLAGELKKTEGDVQKVNNPDLALGRNCGEKTEIAGGYKLDLTECPEGQEIKLPLSGEDAYKELTYKVELLVTTGQVPHTVDTVLPTEPIIKAKPGSTFSLALNKGGNEWVLRGDMWYTYKSEATTLRVVKK